MTPQPTEVILGLGLAMISYRNWSYMLPSDYSISPELGPLSE